MNQLISIIIPTYNTGQYLPDCIDSVLSQTYQNFEILLIDDGSEDDTLSVCYQEAKKDPRIQVFSAPHQGASVARNTAMQHAKGESFVFLDSDDIIHPLFLEILYHRAKETNAEVVGCDLIKIPTEKIKEEKKKFFDRKLNLKWISIPKKKINTFFHNSYEALNTVSCKLISKRLIHGQLFMPGIDLGEDTLFMYEIVLKGFQMEYSQTELYLYRIHDTSITHRWDPIQKKNYYKVYEMIRDKEYELGHPKVAEKWIIIHTRTLFRKYREARKEHQFMIAKQLKNDAFTLLKRPDFPQPKVLYYIVFQFPFLRYVYKIPRKIYRSLFKRDDG